MLRLLQLLILSVAVTLLSCLFSPPQTVAANRALISTLSLLLFGSDTDCNGEPNGTASLDACNVCVGGNTGKFSCAGLNDTGVTWSGEYSQGNSSTCTDTLPEQDCEFGLDTTHNNNGDGHAGFSFVKIDMQGNLLPDDAQQWSCVKDNVTGLIWEVKTTANGLHNYEDTFNWYSSDSAANGGSYPSSENNDGDVCYGYDESSSDTYCNTEAYTARVNMEGLCGKANWRMPTVLELIGIVSFDRTNPTIDTDYFPNTSTGTGYSIYWTDTPDVLNYWAAWYVTFQKGSSAYQGRNTNYNIRLVSSN